MKRRAMLSAIVMACAMTVMMLTGGNNAVAQQNLNCCHYTVIVGATVPFDCFPVTLWTRWDCTPGILLSNSYNAAGTYVEPIGPPLLPPCPPSCHLGFISLDNVRFIGPGQSWQYHLGNCCFLLNFGYEANGCILIKINKC